MFEEVFDIVDIMGSRPLLAWVSYPPNRMGAFCFAYPQWVQTGDEFVRIPPSVLPDRGAVFVSVQGGDNAGSIEDKFGEVVVATINADNIDNRNYDGEEVGDRCFALLNRRFSHSEIEFASLKDHRLGRSLVQIVELEDADVELTRPLRSPIGLVLDTPAPLTQWVMVERVEGSQLSYYGPFTAQQTVSGEYELDAVADFRQRVLKLDSSEIGDIVAVERRHENVGNAAKFVERATLNRLYRRLGSARGIDWVTDEELVDALADVMKGAADIKMGAEGIKAIKRAIEKCVITTSGLFLNDERKERMERLLDQPAAWERKIDVLAAAMARPAVSDRLMELALTEAYFPRVRDLFVENEAIQEQVETELRKYRAETEKARRAAEEAKAAKVEADRQLEANKASAEAVRVEALSSVREELDRACRERDEAVEELDAARKDLRMLDEQARDIIGQLDGGAVAVREMASRRVFRELGATVGPAASPAAESGAGVSCAVCHPREDEDDMESQEIVACLREQIVDRAARAMTDLHIVNLLVCLMSANITVLSGLPGTGKTSLATVLAGALGLARPEAPRFLKIPVERGWTSHRDYIGYYNPLSGHLEASNTAVFSEMLALDEECRAAGTADGVSAESVPYLMLLDEANLSVVENYWSPFLSNADACLSQPTELSMQGGRSLMLPSSVRWIATVNYDHTTEALSERFLNRAWVINLESGALSLDDLLDSSDLCDFSSVPPFSYGKLMEVFGPQEHKRIEDPAAKRLLANFFAECEKQGRPVSYRCQRAIARYVATAEPLMRELSLSAGVRAADFALVQRVLPSLNGTGAEMRNFLEKLQQMSPSLELTGARIDRMLAAGDADGFYQFFV